VTILANSKLIETIVPAVIPPLSAVSTDIGMKVTYIGTEASATVEVSATGDITFKHGAAGSEAVDSTVGASGVLDLSTPAAGLLSQGLVVDAINISPNWRAVLWSNLRADLTDGRYITRSAAQAKGVVVDLLNDTTIVGATTTYIMGQVVSRKNLQGRDDTGWYNAITSIDGIYTDAGVVAILTITSVNVLKKIETEIWRNVLALASATQFTFNEADWGEMPKYGFAGEHLLVQLRAPTTTFTSPSLVVGGFHQLVSGGANRTGVISAQ